MPTPDESKILKIIEAEGGECGIRKIAGKMRMTPQYVSIILCSMGERDLIDVFRTGKIRLARKGWTALGKKEQQIDGLKRYLEDRDKWKTF
ncbi:MAG: hypothetical protein KJ666_09960 [Bacteroidetes bacterium]|nr:hypothetical protein [Bacteroidota bacterium]